ncbi:GT-D fold domain-containing protein [Anaerovorax odorimutans]|uniref:GT-D fold domain-containing protein n=1 Tax=Anaerovorax odorimutans TaxID=109327 RepID=UPI0003FA3986|nr:GT-D fold domain-containing glycosyltransferase [Anaerovorax odorimutans]
MSNYIQTEELLEKWIEIIESKVSHASIRIGDGEAAVAAHEKILTMDFVNKVYPWVRKKNICYCGVILPNKDIREQLIWSLRQADFLGVLSQTSRWVFKPIADMIIEYYKLNPKSYFYAFDNYKISTMKKFYKVFKDMSVLLVGVKSKYFKEVLERRYGWSNIAGCVDCPNWDYLNDAIKEMDKYNYRVALVSAGVPGKILCAHAKIKGNVGIDFGSGVDTCLESDLNGLYAWELKYVPKRNYISIKD